MNQKIVEIKDILLLFVVAGSGYVAFLVSDEKLRYLSIALAVVSLVYFVSLIVSRKNSINSLSDTEYKLNEIETFFDYSPIAILAISDGNIVYTNRTAKSTFEFDKSFDPSMFIPKRFLDTSDKDEDNHEVVETTIESKNKKSFPARVYLSYKDSFIIVSIHNISNEKDIEEKTKQESRNLHIGEMIVNIAHQWRQPLSAISMIASSSKLNSQLGMLSSTELEKSYDDIAEQVNFLSQTLEDFKNYYHDQ
jgi:nitrogen-specific signal transduction histidine kinase